MKKKLVTLMLMLCMVAVPLTGCTLPGIGDIGAEKDDDDDDDDKDGDKDSSATKIKLSEDEVTITEGDSFEVTVKNADDLKKLSVESDDEDLVEADLDEDTITLTAGEVDGNEETTVIVSAKGCDDREISVTIIDLDDSGSGSDSSGSHDSDPVSTLPDDVIPDDSDDSKPSSSSDTGAYSEVAGTYSGYIYFSEDAEKEFYTDSLGLSYDLACDMAASGSFSVKTVATLTSYGDVSLKMDMNSFIDSLCYAIEDNYVAFYREAVDDYTTSDSDILAEKYEQMEYFKSQLVTMYDYGNSSSDSLTTTNEGTYTYSDGRIWLDNGTYWEYDSESPQCIIIDTSELGVAGTDSVYLFKE